MPEKPTNEILTKIPDDIISAITNGKTSIGKNPAIPGMPNSHYLEQLIQYEWEDSIKKLEQLNIGNNTDLESLLSKLILECQEIEKPYRYELEILCTMKINELFNPPKDYVWTDLSLVDSLSLKDNSIIIDPVDGKAFQFDSYDDALDLESEIYKRRFLDMLCMGAGLSFSSALDFYSDEIYDLNPKLIELYEKILALNTYLLLSKSDLNINDKNTKQIGANVVKLSEPNNIVQIIAQGKIFPVLFAETVRGFMELFASHGLPKDISKAMLVIGKSDFIKAEPWDMRIGPMLWKIIYCSLNNENTEAIPYLFKKISQLKPDAFFMFMREILLNTKKSNALISIIKKRAEKEMQEDSLIRKTPKNNNELPIISDEISPLEL